VLAHTRQVRSEWAVAALADWTDDEAELLGRLIERLSADLAAAGVDRALHPVPG